MGRDVFFVVVVAERKFREKKPEELFVYSPVLVKPVFGVAPEPFNAVDRVPAFRSSFLLCHHHMLTPQSERGVRLVVIGVVQGPRSGVVPDLFVQRGMFSVGDDGKTNIPVPLVDTEDQDLSGGAPASPAFSPAPEGRFVHFKLAGQGVEGLFVREEGPADIPEEVFRCPGRTPDSDP